MNLRIAIFGLAASICLLTGSQAGAVDPAPSLTANPFERPAWLSDARAAPAAELTGRQRSPLDLRATLMAGKQSLADVGGKIIGIGEEVDGYQLISVGEGVATFSDGVQTLHVSVIRNDKDEDNEAR